jgi:hypothetical protein
MPASPMIRSLSSEAGWPAWTSPASHAMVWRAVSAAAWSPAAAAQARSATG